VVRLGNVQLVRNESLRFLALILVLLLGATAAAADEASDLAAVMKFDREIRQQLTDSQGRHAALQVALRTASYEETMKLVAAEEVRDRDAAKAVDRMVVPAEPKDYATGLANAKRQAVGALEARRDGNARLASTREKAYAALAEGILARLKRR
jgi:hypothetical protein